MLLLVCTSTVKPVSSDGSPELNKKRFAQLHSIGTIEKKEEHRPRAHAGYLKGDYQRLHTLPARAYLPRKGALIAASDLRQHKSLFIPENNEILGARYLNSGVRRESISVRDALFTKDGKSAANPADWLAPASANVANAHVTHSETFASCIAHHTPVN